MESGEWMLKLEEREEITEGDKLPRYPKQIKNASSSHWGLELFQLNFLDLIHTLSKRFFFSYSLDVKI